MLLLLAGLIAPLLGTAPPRADREGVLPGPSAAPPASLPAPFEPSGALLRPPLQPPAPPVAPGSSPAGPSGPAAADRAPNAGGRAVVPFEYVVEPGDSLKSIAARFGISLQTLLSINDLADPDTLPIGTRLLILPVDGVLHTVRPGDTVVSIAETYEADVAAVIAGNQLEPPYVILPDQKLVVPGGRIPWPKLLARYAPATPEPVVAPAPAAASPQAAPASGEPSGQAAAATPAESLPPPPANATPGQREFIALLAPIARSAERATGVPASVTLGVAIHESYWGISRLAREGNNLYGIKAIGRGGTAGVITFPTWEVVGGRSVTVQAAFRAYATVADSVEDFTRLISGYGRYAAAMRQQHDSRAFVRAVAAGGYATDPAWAAKVIGLMDRYDLYRYDLP